MKSCVGCETQYINNKLLLHQSSFLFYLFHLFDRLLTSIINMKYVTIFAKERDQLLLRVVAILQEWQLLQ